jgi:hypothetical protein
MQHTGIEAGVQWIRIALLLTPQTGRRRHEALVALRELATPNKRTRPGKPQTPPRRRFWPATAKKLGACSSTNFGQKRLEENIATARSTTDSITAFCKSLVQRPFFGPSAGLQHSTNCRAALGRYTKIHEATRCS